LTAVRKEIREITGDNLEKSVEIIRAGFGTVAKEMGYTEAIVSFFPAFIKIEHLKALRDRGAIFFGAFIDGEQSGFIAVEKENDGNYHLKRLAVSPEYRHDGLGKMLIDHAIAFIKNKGHNKVQLAMADENPVLKKWYLDMGFKETSVQKFEHLPFPVSFMEKDIGQGD
jgi:diamine N-acetyltransferase